MASPLPIKCGCCKKSIKQQHRSRFALKETWHKECFSCCICKKHLDDMFFSRNKKLYCKKHYLQRFAQVCYRCNMKVNGLVMIAGDVTFHLECFKCVRCRRCIGRDEDYVFEERAYLYCPACYQSDVAGYMKYKKFKTFQKQAVHQFHITSSHLKKKKLRFAVKEHHHQNLLSELNRKFKSQEKRRVSIVSDEDNPLALCTGDTVIEINGIPVSDSNIKQFSKILQTADTEKPISITVERNKSNSESDACQELSCATPCSARTPKSVDGTTYNRNVSFFNFSLFPRSLSDVAGMEAQAIRRKRKSVNKGFSLDAVPEHNSCKYTESTENGNLVKSKSLNDIKNLSFDEDRLFIRKECEKATSPLHRSQSIKPTHSKMCVEQVFRPDDLIFNEVIGKGFFGDVFKVTHKSTGKQMVVKKLREFDAEAEEQFIKELQVLKALNHPNILHCIGFMYNKKSLHIILEYAPDGTIRQLLKNKDIELSWQEKIDLSKDIASGMAYLHEECIMHRDLKTKNVLLQKLKNGGRRALVADFGLASVMHDDHISFISTSQFAEFPISPRQKRRTTVGSPYYMAPEMLNRKPYDETVDIFSYGIVLCEIMGRVKSDPDYLPRTSEFGLNVEGFRLKFPETPDYFLNLAGSCCNMNPLYRPSFNTCEKWLETFLGNLNFDIPLPEFIDYTLEPKPIRLNSVRSRKIRRSLEKNKIQVS